ncbi:MAG: carbohydrate kinase family protein [SAR202 cluster bacterium]|jgi:sugar/nucleoside kinase (ribokinase family)|nr:PfkB family carbohydrate kinase [Dehalococcoidia bacterium]MQF88347.1 carbohydrate kinase family protein [SAR202 cluster bacterium]
MQQLSNDQNSEPFPGGAVVCFGVLSYLQLMVVDQTPVHNAGTPIRQLIDSYGDDAAIVAGMLHQWGQDTKLIPSAVGDDELGRKVAETVARLGVPVQVEVNPDVATVAELSIADPSGARTYFYQRTPELLATLDAANLAPLESAAYLYVDWYDGDHILRPMRAASELGIPVLVNLEDQSANSGLLAKLAPYTTACQVSVDNAESGNDLESIAGGLLEAGMGTVLITGGSRGCLVADLAQRVRVSAPAVKVVDGNGAGSCFSAAFIYANLQGWNLEQCARFATAQSSLKCGVPGYQVATITEGERLAATLRLG